MQSIKKHLHLYLSAIFVAEGVAHHRRHIETRRARVLALVELKSTKKSVSIFRPAGHVHPL